MSNGSAPAAPAQGQAPPPEGPGGKPAGTWLIFGLSSVLLGLTAFVFLLLIQLWPYPTPSTEPPPVQANVRAGQPAPTDTTLATRPGTDTAGADTTRLSGPPAMARGTMRRGADTAAGIRAGGSPPSPRAAASAETTCQDRLNRIREEWAGSRRPAPAACVQILGRERFLWDEQRLLILVMLGGALGGLLHALRSLGWYVGNRELVKSWTLRYLVLGFTGAALAFVFYVVIRGGFFSPGTSFESTSPFGFVAFATLVGLFSEQAVLKLKQVAETLLAKPGPGEDARPQNTAPGAPGAAAPKITKVEQHKANGVATGNFTVTGTGFDPAAEVWVGDTKQVITARSATQIDFALSPVPNAGTTLVIQVRNPGNRTDQTQIVAA